MRIALMSLALLAAAPALAAEPPPGRYTFAPAEGGALRLDTQTGEVSFCGGRPEAPACAPVPETGARPAADASAVEERLAALEARVAELEAGAAAGDVLLPDDETVDQVMALTDKVIRRFFGMVQEMKRDLEGEAL